MMFKSICFILPCLLLANCASIVSKSNYPVTINSNPAGAKFLVKKSNGEVVHQGTTPATVTLKSSRGYFQPETYKLEFSKKGLPKQNVELAAGLNGWYIGNLGFGGLIGLVIVDPLTGAMWRLDDKVEANLTPMATLDNGNGNKLRVVDRRSLPSNLQDRLIALN